MTSPEVERLTTTDAARRLGVSPSTVRRRIASGHLNAERHRRPQGVRYVVLWEPTGPAVLPVPARDVEAAAVEAPVVEAVVVDAPEPAREVLAGPERIGWFWWLVFPAITALGMAAGRWLS